jgi:hypothetical protein
VKVSKLAPSPQLLRNEEVKKIFAVISIRTDFQVVTCRDIDNGTARNEIRSSVNKRVEVLQL